MDDLESDFPEMVEVEIGDVLDLHSFPPSEVADVVRSYLDAATEKGLTQIRIIHGKGIGVQRRTVRRILQQDPRVLVVSNPDSDAGGWGATCATLRPARERTSGS